MNDNEEQKKLKLDSWLGNGERSTLGIPLVARTIMSFYNGDILDVGCGNGDLLRELSSLGIPRNKLFGSDIEEGHVELAKQRTNGLPIAWCDFSAAQPFPGKKFDCIAAIGWVHNYWPQHYAISLPPDQRCEGDYMQGIISQVLEALAPKGRFIYDWCNENRHPHSAMLEILNKNGLQRVAHINATTYIVVRKCDL